MNDKHKVFWEWFSKNSLKYMQLEQDRESLFDKLQKELHKIDSGLAFEFSHRFEDGTREFILSANGIKSKFPIVIELVRNAPVLQDWKIIAFRQPHLQYSQIQYENLTVSHEDVYFRFAPNDKQLAVELNIRGYNDSNSFQVITYLILDNVIGEYATEMYLSYIGRKRLNEDEVENLFPITDLPQILEEFRSKLEN